MHCVIANKPIVTQKISNQKINSYWPTDGPGLKAPFLLNVALNSYVVVFLLQKLLLRKVFNFFHKSNLIAALYPYPFLLKVHKWELKK